MKNLIPFFVFLIFTNLQSQNIDRDFISSVDSGLVLLSELHGDIKHIHPVLEKLQPVALIKGDQLYIFDADSTEQKYAFTKLIKAPFQMNEGIRASFPLAEYDMKPVCVIGKDALTSPGGRAVVLHEFVHCSQFNTVEMQIKNELDIYKDAVEQKNYSWEIAHPFPFDTIFLSAYREFHKALMEEDKRSAKSSRDKIRRMLDPINFEYMVWQEWKEGFARFIENQIREATGTKINNGGSDYPQDRIVFYYGGEMLIKFLLGRNDEITSNLPQLFYLMFSFGEN